MNITLLHIILLISDFENTATSKRVTISCSQWKHVEFSYPADVTDVILLYQCLDGMEDTIHKVGYFCQSQNYLSLPTASEGWGKVMFLVCPQGVGVPKVPTPLAKVPNPPSPAKSGWGRGYLKVPTPRQGTYPPIQVRMGGYPKELTPPPTKVPTPPRIWST